MAGKVLIIDDSAYARHQLKSLLSHAGYSVAEAEGVAWRWRCWMRSIPI